MRTLATPTAKRAQVAARRQRALSLRMAGLDWQSIADKLGYASRGAACTDVDRAYKTIKTELDETVHVHRVLESARLDRLQVGVWTKALAGDVRAVDAVLRIMTRRAKLLGLDGAGAADASSPDELTKMLDQLLEDVAREARESAVCAHCGTPADAAASL
jgi:hypothetical protein